MYRDPSEFRERFKAYKDGKSVREIYGLPGYAGGKFDAATKKKIDYYYKKLRSNGFDMMSAIGILGNMMQESSFNPDIVNHLGYHGLLLNSKAIQNAIKNLYGDLSEQSLLRYLSDWTDGATWIRKGPYASDTALYSKSYLRSGYKTPEQAAYEFLKRYERAIVVDPKTKKALRDANGNYVYLDKDKRLGYAKSIYNYLSGRPDGIQDLIALVGATQPEPIIAVPDATRVSTIPTIQLKAIDYSDRRNAVAAEALRAMWAHNVMEDMKGAYQVPIWESHSLPALEPIELDVTPFKYNNGKLPGYQLGKAKAIQQGRKLIPIDKAEAATEPDYNEGWFLTTIKRGVNNAIKTVKDQVRAARNIINGRGTLGDYIEVGIDALTGAAGKLLSGSAKEAKQVARRTLKPTKASTKKFDTRDPNKVGAYYSAHPEEVTPIINNPEVKEVVNFMNNHIGPKYAKQNGVHIGIDPSDINIGYADLSGSNLGGYVGPSGEVVINKDILNNRDLLRYVLGHEIAGHWFDQHYPLTVPQMSTVGYGMPFKQDFLAERPWFNAIKEANAERRAFLLMTYFDKGVLGEDLDEAIKHMAKAEAKRYIDRLGYARGIDWQWPDILPFKQAATSVPAAGAGIYLAGNEEYKNGKLPGYYEGELPMGEQRLLTDEEVKLAAQNASHEQGMSGEDPLMSVLVGMKAVRLVGDLLAERRLKEKAEMYKRWREANELTRGASRAWKMLDADSMARNWGYSDNPLGFLYDVFLDPIANMYTKIQKHPILGPLIPFSDGKLPGYSNGKIRIKPANRGKFNATKKRTGKTTEELTHSKNPLTRKRAIFAQNARKWNHK